MPKRWADIFIFYRYSSKIEPINNKNSVACASQIRSFVFWYCKRNSRHLYLRVASRLWRSHSEFAQTFIDNFCVSVHPYQLNWIVILKILFLWLMFLKLSVGPAIVILEISTSKFSSPACTLGFFSEHEELSQLYCLKNKFPETVLSNLRKNLSCWLYAFKVHDKAVSAKAKKRWWFLLSKDDWPVIASNHQYLPLHTLNSAINKSFAQTAKTDFPTEQS